MPDVPAAAYTKAVLALDEFDSRAIEYSMLVDVERALLRNRNFNGIAETVERADHVARAAAMCGARVAALRAELELGAFTGRRAAELRGRFASARRRSEELHLLSEGMAVEFARARSAASAELGSPASGNQTRGAAGYAIPRRSLALDKTA